MAHSEIEGKAAFDYIRYAQLWEDADILNSALGNCAAGTLVSICSAGDNALAMLLLDPAKVVVVDLSPAQIACLKLRIAAYSTLTHAEFLELMGARSSTRRKALLASVVAGLDDETQVFWTALAEDVARFGAGGVGKIERYFRIFRTWFLPLVHNRATRDDIFVPRDRQGRQVFFDARFNTWRWRMLLQVFFSRFVMGRMGRDKAFLTMSMVVPRSMWGGASITQQWQPTRPKTRIYTGSLRARMALRCRWRGVQKILM